MNISLLENMMTYFKRTLGFRVVPGRYINTLAKGKCQKGLDTSKRIVSELLTGGIFFIKGLLFCLTLAKCKRDTSKRIVEVCFFKQIKNTEKPFRYSQEHPRSTGHKVPCLPQGLQRIVKIIDVFGLLRSGTIKHIYKHFEYNQTHFLKGY